MIPPVSKLYLALFLSSFTVSQAVELTSLDLGNPAPKEGKTHIIAAGRDYDIEGYGTIFGNHVSSDQGRFVYVRISGDFDVSAQIEGVESSIGGYAEGGLQARKDLDSKSLFAAQFVTCNNYKKGADQYTFLVRLQEGGSVDPAQTHFIRDFFGKGIHGYAGMLYCGKMWLTENTTRPRPFPHVWIRLKREGNKYSGFYKEGEKDWVEVTEATVDLGANPYVGLCLSANHHGPEVIGKVGDPTNLSTASFRNLQGFGN